jgi:hypothetical protein
MRAAITALVLLALGGCGGRRAARPVPPEARSLFGKPLYPPPLSKEKSREYTAKLNAAQKQAAAAPGVDANIWVGRRLGYLGKFREAIDFFTGMIAKTPADPRLYRHRGHRYITVREFDAAITTSNGR